MVAILAQECRSTDQKHLLGSVGAIKGWFIHLYVAAVAHIHIKLEIEFRVYYSFGEATVTRKENKGKLT